jgi:hypothetical protein
MRVSKSVVAIGLGAIVIIGSGSAVAATGHNLILGHKNSATKTTTLSDSKGTPLSLKARKGHAPFAVNSSKVVTHLNADLLDGLSSSALQRKITGKCAAGTAATAVSGTSLTCTAVTAPTTNVITLSAGTNTTTNGTALVAVLGALTTATATNGYSVELGPGTWDLGTTALTVPKHVDLVGAGADLTTITSSVDGGDNPTAGPAPTAAVVDLSADTTLSDATVVNTNSDRGTATAAKFQVGVLATGAGGAATGSDLVISIPNAEDGVGLAVAARGTLLVRNVKATIDGSDFAEGFRANDASTLTASNGVLALTGADAAISAGTNTGSTVKVVDTQMPSASSFNDGSSGATVTCFGDYTAALAAATC